MQSKIKEALDFRLKTKQDKEVFYVLFSLCGNAVMLIIELIFAWLTLSIWLLANAGFHFVIGLSRALSVRDYIKIRLVEKNPKIGLDIGYKNYRKTGLLLVILGVIYLLISIYMLFNSQANEFIRGDVIVIGVAAIAFWCLGLAIYELIKYKKEHDPIINAIKMTNNANALTMIVLAQVVLLAEFGEGVDYSFYNAGTGIAMSIIIILLGVYMLNVMKKDLERSGK